MKKKIISLCLVLALALTAIGGATLAYFTDTDAQKNTFTTGNVTIDLWEDFGDNDDNGIEHLVPATGSAQQGTLKNGIEKEVYVENTGSEDAYVRVHIAIPSILDDGADTFDAGKNVLHFNYTKDSIGEGKWNWTKNHEESAANHEVTKTNGKAYNYYTTTIDNVSYNVYVVTYETALKKGDMTVDAMEQVYLDSNVTNADIAKIKNTLGDKWYIYVVAEGCQAAGFDDAYAALNTSFGTPGSEGYKAPSFKDMPKYKKWIDTESTTVTP